MAEHGDIVERLRDPWEKRLLLNGRAMHEEAAAEIEELRGLLSAASCPTCDGRGWYVGPGYDGEAVQVQCEWCDRRASVLATNEPPAPAVGGGS